MSIQKRIRIALACLMVAAASPALAGVPIPTSFTYQGSLNDGTTPATNLFDFQFTLYDAATGGIQIGTQFVEDLQVVSGIFTVELDFGSPAYALTETRWLEIGVRPGATRDPYVVLPRQKLTATPYALSMALPLSQGASSAMTLLSVRNQGTGAGGTFEGGSGATLGYGLIGISNSTASQAAGVRGIAAGTSGLNIGVEGVGTTSTSGTGMVATGNATGIFVNALNNTTSSVGVYAVNSGAGSAMFATGQGSQKSAATIRAVNSNSTQGMAAWLSNSSGFATTQVTQGGSGQCMLLEQNGSGHFIQALTPTGTKFWVDATGTTHTKVLEILGGADLSEKFDVRAEAGGHAGGGAGGAALAVEPGTVVSIDPTTEGKLLVSREPYDHRVAGIVSGAGGVKPGMLMGQDGTVASGEHPIALTGRVYCKATAAGGAIRPGDLLTTSSIPGHAMRVADPSRAQGAILGKAMGSLEKGEGLVLVLVGLQ
jgi:hypothetical protein